MVATHFWYVYDGDEIALRMTHLNRLPVGEGALNVDVLAAMLFLPLFEKRENALISLEAANLMS